MIIQRRYFIAGIAGLAATVGMGVIMARLIEVDFAAPEKIETQSYDINPVADDITVMKDRTRLKPYDPVDIPPATPRIDTAQNTSVIVEPITADPVDFDWTPPPIDKTRFIIHAADTDEQPLLRPAPQMPARADRSGHCIMAFDVTSEGAPFNIRAARCSDKIFARASVKAVAKWRYRPKVVNGQAVTRSGMRNKIRFQLTDEAGRIIPE